MQNPMENKVVLNYKDVVLRKLDMDVLKGPCFLNDEVIRFYFSYLSSLCTRDDIAFVPPSVSYWLANCDVDSRKDAVEPLNLGTKRLVLFPDNDNDEFDGAESGTHRSVLIYDRSTNLFIHMDTMQGVNHDNALKLYDSVKEFIGKAPIRVPSQSSSLKGNKQKKKNKRDEAKMIDGDVACADMVFKECHTIQQTNEYDCVTDMVIAIAKSVTDFNHLGKSVEEADWLSFVEKKVDTSVEMNFRNEVLRLMEDLRND